MKSRVLLVFPAYDGLLSETPPVGITYIASYVLQKLPSSQVKIIDCSKDGFSEESWLKELNDFQPDVVGISVQTLNYPSARKITRVTRQYDPDILLVMGGVNATLDPEECLKHCDIVVRGEGEKSFLEICQGAKWEDIKGISFKNEEMIQHNEPRERIKDLDEIPFRAEHLLDVKGYKFYPSWNLIGSRGCPYACTFCCSPLVWKRVVNLRSVKNIVDEMEDLQAKYDIKHIDICDDMINISQQRTFDICHEIIARGLHNKLTFACSMRANRQLVSLELFQKLKEANFIKVCLGIESASKKVCALMKKNLPIADVSRFIRLARKANIQSVEGYLIVGNWGETLWDVLKTWRFAIFNNIEPSFSICTPFPGTEFYRLQKSNGYLTKEPDWANFNQYTPIARTDKMSRLQILLVYFVSVLLCHTLLLIRTRKLKYGPSGLLKSVFARMTTVTRAIKSLYHAA